MTDEQKLEILEEREQHAFGVLKSLEPTTNEFLCCMESIRQVQRLVSKVRFPVAYAGRIEIEPEPDRADVPAADTWEAGGNASVEAETPVETEANAKEETADKAPWDEPAAAQKEPAKTYTKEEVTAILTDLRNNHGVDIAGVMQSLGFAKLSLVPVDRYAGLIETAQAAAKERT